MFSYTAHQDIATNLCYVLHLVEINLRNNLNDNFKAFVQKDDWMKHRIVFYFFRAIKSSTAKGFWRI
jgi:hypothetical protein